MKDCVFDLSINRSFPDDKQLINNYRCQSDKWTDPLGNYSCYATALIDYDQKTMNIILKIMPNSASFSAQYAELGKINENPNNIITYGIMGNVAQGTTQMSIAIKCMTHDNCALEQLRTRLPDSSKIDKGLKIFHQIYTSLNKGEKKEKPHLL